jgi:hypothetical protein
MTTSARRAAVASALAYVAITFVMGRQVLASLGTAIVSDPGDPVLSAAILAWNAEQVPWSEAWFQFPAFYPTADTLTLSEHLLGVSVIATPLYWLTGHAVTTYNLTLLATYPLAGTAMYALLWRLTGSGAAAFLAGLAFAFAPYRVSELPHIQVLAVFWAPLALLGLHAYLEPAGPRSGEAPRRTRRWPWLVLFAVSWMLQGAANGYLLVFFSVLIGLWVLWFVVARRRWRDFMAIAAAALLAVLPLAPILNRFIVVHQREGLTRGLTEVASFGADIAAPLCASSRLTFWGWLQFGCAEGELFAGAALVAICAMSAIAIRSERRAPGGPARGGWFTRPDRGEPAMVMTARRVAVATAGVYLAIAASTVIAGPWRVDVGFLRASVSSPVKPVSTALALLLVALVLSPRARAAVRRGAVPTFYAGAALTCWVLSWGPFPRLLGTEVLYQAPYAWLMQLPGVGGLRVPARFWMVSLICLVVLMGVSIARVLARCRRSTAASLVIAAACGLLIDGWTTIPVAPLPPEPPDAGTLRGATVITLPVGDTVSDALSALHAVTGGWKTVNGYSGYEPGYYEALRTLAAAGDEALFAPFRGRGALHVLIDDADSAARAFVERQPGAELLVRRDGARQYRLRPQRGVERPAPDLGRRLDTATLRASCSPEGLAYAIDGRLDTRWVCGVQTADHQISIDLGRVTAVGALVYALGSTAANFPRDLIVETAVDGEVWQAAWQGSPAAEVFSAALAAPLETRLMLQFTPREARHIRLRQVGRDERNYWSIAELEVWSPRR